MIKDLARNSKVNSACLSTSNNTSNLSPWRAHQSNIPTGTLMIMSTTWGRGCKSSQVCICFPLVVCLTLLTRSGPDVYRKIFRRYCCRGGPLQDFNVSEIVDKAVSLRASLIKVAVEDGEDQEQWVLDIPDPRKPPAALR